jgi:hypothetical protein
MLFGQGLFSKILFEQKPAYTYVNQNAFLHKCSLDKCLFTQMLTNTCLQICFWTNACLHRCYSDKCLLTELFLDKGLFSQMLIIQMPAYRYVFGQVHAYINVNRTKTCFHNFHKCKLGKCLFIEIFLDKCVLHKF